MSSLVMACGRRGRGGLVMNIRREYDMLWRQLSGRSQMSARFAGEECPHTSRSYGNLAMFGPDPGNIALSFVSNQAWPGLVQVTAHMWGQARPMCLVPNSAQNLTFPGQFVPTSLGWSSGRLWIRPKFGQNLAPESPRTPPIVGEFGRILHDSEARPAYADNLRGPFSGTMFNLRPARRQCL